GRPGDRLRGPAAAQGGLPGRRRALAVTPAVGSTNLHGTRPGPLAIAGRARYNHPGYRARTTPPVPARDTGNWGSPQLKGTEQFCQDNSPGPHAAARDVPVRTADTLKGVPSFRGWRAHAKVDAGNRRRFPARRGSRVRGRPRGGKQEGPGPA